MSLEQLILNKAEKKLAFYRAKGKELQERNPEYSYYLKRIEELYKKATYWHVDALLGEQTRQHNDLDIAVESKDLEKTREVLASHGYQ